MAEASKRQAHRAEQAGEEMARQSLAATHAVESTFDVPWLWQEARRRFDAADAATQRGGFEAFVQGFLGLHMDYLLGVLAEHGIRTDSRPTLAEVLDGMRRDGITLEDILGAEGVLDLLRARGVTYAHQPSAEGLQRLLEEHHITVESILTSPEALAYLRQRRALPGT